MNENNLNVVYQQYFSKKEADQIFEELEREIEYFPSEMTTVVVFNKRYPVPRKVSAYGDKNLTYTFSGNTLPTKPLIPILNKFEQYKQEFLNCQVDGDLLLQLDDKSLKEDIGMINGIHRKRFMRLLNELKCSTDYSSKDKTGLYDFLKSLGAEYCQYTYQMLLNGVQTDDLKDMSCKQLELDCGISNSVHREKILHKAKYESRLSYSLQVKRHQISKSVDVFISYRRSNGSHLASFLYYYLIKHGFSVFLDVVTLGKGIFGSKALHNIQIAKNFLLLLTTDALDRCKGDETCQDWLHKEIVGALNSRCNIIPILDKFEWPDSSELPKDMRLIYLYNAVE
ncbi:unnamed protein product [Larinioides sclopetarius]